MLRVDKEAVARRLQGHIDAVSQPEFSSRSEAISRYAFHSSFMRTLDYFESQFKRLGFEVELDAVGNFIARNRPRGTPCFALGSHLDSNRNGGRFDGTLGVVAALEVCELAHELGLGLPLQVIAFAEEEGSGFGVMLFGSRVAAGELDEGDLRAARSLDDGRSFWEHAADAGLGPENWGEVGSMFGGLFGWIELHIEQGRTLEERGLQVAIVDHIVGYVHGQLLIEGRADHAGATPMDLRRDAGVVAALGVAELERLALEAGGGLVGTVGEMALEPGLINVVPGRARIGFDVRGTEDGAVLGVVEKLVKRIAEIAAERGLTATYTQRHFLPASQMDPDLVELLSTTADALGYQAPRMQSGAGHDTISVSRSVPSAMVFVPCRDGVSHSPEEDANMDDVAVAVEVMLNTVAERCRLQQTEPLPE